MVPKTRKSRTTPVNPARYYRRHIVSITMISVFLTAGMTGFANTNQRFNTTASPDFESVPLWGGLESLNVLTTNEVLQSRIKLHHFDQVACGSCHEPPGTADDATSVKTNWKTGVDINRSCTSSGCHEYDQRMNHAVGVSVPADVSGRMPLGQSSEITCLTCHDADSAVGADVSQERFLISPDPTICQSCHGELSGTLKQQSHWKFSQKAHLVSLVPDSASDRYNAGLMASGIDRESQNCLSCHDEISATVPAMDGGRYGSGRGYNMSDHPIGMNYQSVAMDNSMFYHSLRDSQNRIRMFDGKVGCGSCHSLYSQTPFHLAVENNNSALCRECHIR